MPRRLRYSQVQRISEVDPTREYQDRSTQESHIATLASAQLPDVDARLHVQRDRLASRRQTTRSTTQDPMIFSGQRSHLVRSEHRINQFPVVCAPDSEAPTLSLPYAFATRCACPSNSPIHRVSKAGIGQGVPECDQIFITTRVVDKCNAIVDSSV